MTQAYPLAWPDGWARTPDHRRIGKSPFQTTFIKARSDLFRQLDLMGASGAVVSSRLPIIEAAFKEGLRACGAAT